MRSYLFFFLNVLPYSVPYFTFDLFFSSSILASNLSAVHRTLKSCLKLAYLWIALGVGLGLGREW